jgi:hypothetical protein
MLQSESGRQATSGTSIPRALANLEGKYASHDFESLSQLISRLSQEIAKSNKPRKNFQKKVSYVDYFDSEDEDNTIGLAEWVKGKKTVSCPFGKRNWKNSALTSLRPIRYLICCFSKGRSNSPSSIPYRLQKSSKGRNIASGTMQRLTTPMLARFSDNRFNQLLNKPFPKLKSR